MLKYTVIKTSHVIRYQRHGEYHRKFLPTIAWTHGFMSWQNYGEYHRKNGPAVIYSSGNREYYIRGKNVEISNHCRF
jgi:hypothetical protein